MILEVNAAWDEQVKHYKTWFFDSEICILFDEDFIQPYQESDRECPINGYEKNE
jgi:hypothetical protein